MPAQTDKLHRPLTLALVFAAAVSAGCGEAENPEATQAQATAAAATANMTDAPDSEPKAEPGAAQAAGSPAARESGQAQAVAATGDYRDVSWEELIPKEDLDALLNPPDYIYDIPEGAAGDSFPTEASPSSDPAERRYQQALKSDRIKPEFDRQQVRIPGFVVPLEFDDEQTVTSFLLVPYFGACMHLPPPPPNQVIYADFPQGFQIDALYDPVNIEGQLRTLPRSTELGAAAYTMQVTRVSPYVD